MDEPKKQKKERVVVTGLGVVSGLGASPESCFDSLIQGISPVAKIEIFDTTHWPNQWGVCIADLDRLWRETEIPSELKYLNLSRETKLGIYAAIQAVKDANLLTDVGTSLNGGVYCGGSNAGFKPQDIVDLLEGFEFSSENFAHLEKFFEKEKIQIRLKKFDEVQSPCFLGRLLANEFCLNHGYTTIETACAGGSQAIGMGFEAVSRKEMTYAFCVAADSMVSEFVFASFCKLGVMLPYDSSLNPKNLVKALDEERKGFVPGEGGVCLILESYENAIRRKAKIYAEVVAHGESSSAYRVTDMPPNGDGPKQAMHMALNQADISYLDLDYVNLHGTGTLQNDPVEVQILNELASGSWNHSKVNYDDGKKIYVASTKPLTGHLVSAAGAIESMIAILSLSKKILAPNINLSRPLFLEKPFAYCPNRYLSNLELNYALTNSFGFGGVNSTLIFKACEES